MKREVELILGKKLNKMLYAYLNGMRKIIWNLSVNTIANSVLVPRRTRSFIYNSSGMSINTNKIMHGCTFLKNNIEIGHNSLLNIGCFINGSEKVTIGENVSISFDVSIITVTHEKGESSKRAGDTLYLPVTINNGVWVGARSTILPGVTIGEGCIIAAGSLVNKSCEPNGLYAGVPARRIKDLD